MVAQMNRTEDAARLAMGDLGTDLKLTTVHVGPTRMVKFGFALAGVMVAALIIGSLLYPAAAAA